jgi:hypothetical protein
MERLRAEFVADLRVRPDRCSGCGYHPPTQGHAAKCCNPARLPEVNSWPLSWAAYFYASIGIPVHPLKAGEKEPDSEHGVHDATTNLEQVRAWWDANPYRNIGLGCGVAFDVLDVDVRDGKPGMAWLRTLIDAGLTTGVWAKARTPSGGLHLLFAPGGLGCPGALGAFGLDYKGKGGYVVGPPSYTIAADNASEGYYRWEAVEPGRWGATFDYEAAKTAFGVSKPAPAPRISSNLPRINSGNSAYVGKAVADELEALRNATKGSRNNQLNTSAFNLGQLVGGGEVERGAIETALWGVARAIGLPDREIEKTLRSGLEDGIKQPRAAPKLSVVVPPVTILGEAVS